MWARLDDGIIDHEKIEAAGERLGRRHGYERALGAFTWSLVYANKRLTNGKIPAHAVLRRGLSSEAVDALIQEGLWHQEPDGSYRIHDFLDWNQTAEQVKARQAWDRNRKQLYNNQDLLHEIRARDGDSCRYCGRAVNWRDRRGDAGGTFDHVIPRGGNTAENVVVACRGCNSRKGKRTPDQASMPLLPAGHLVTALEPIQNQSGTEPVPELVPEPDISSPFPTRAGSRDPVPSRPVPSTVPPVAPRAGGRLTRAERKARARVTLGASGPGGWRDRCRELGHAPPCQSPDRCALRVDVAAQCPHQPTCETFGACKQLRAEAAL
jgi:5-methylcytosine-specific restriction endonuclease McrA